MALLTIGIYAVPAPLSESYIVTNEPVVKTKTNAKGLTIGEFVRYRKSIKWSYARLTAAKYAAICAAMQTNIAGTSMIPVAVTYWNPDTNANLTGNFFGSSTAPPLRWFTAGAAEYVNVAFELVEQ